MAKKATAPERGMFGKAKDDYLAAVTPTATSVQKALIDLLSRDVGRFGTTTKQGTNVSRMAADPKVLALLQAMPAVAGTLGVGSALGTLSDLGTGEATLANTPMDVLGMGLGAYGMHKGRVGGTTAPAQTLQILSGLMAGKVGSDAIQGVAGGMV